MRVSLILPYWQRQEAANLALALLDLNYVAHDLEVIVVDDGSPVAFVMPPTRLHASVVRLPRKGHAASPCVPWNRGVAASTGEIIALSCVEILHRVPVLSQLVSTLIFDNFDYVSPAVWCPAQARWHVHSSLSRPPLNFLMLMSRSLFDRVGGFDEDYREGMAFEDYDFVNRLDDVGANYTIRDDLVVEHPREGAKAQYTPAQHERNRALFNAKWGTA